MDIISTLKCSREHYQQKFDLPMENQEFLCQTNQWVLFVSQRQLQLAFWV